MKLLKNEQQKSYENEKICYSFKVKLDNKHDKDKIYLKIPYYCHYVGEDTIAAHTIWTLKYSVPK